MQRLQYLHCKSTRDTEVLHWAIELWLQTFARICRMAVCTQSPLCALGYSPSIQGTPLDASPCCLPNLWVSWFHLVWYSGCSEACTSSRHPLTCWLGSEKNYQHLCQISNIRCLIIGTCFENLSGRRPKLMVHLILEFLFTKWNAKPYMAHLKSEFLQWAIIGGVVVEQYFKGIEHLKLVKRVVYLIITW